MLRHGRPALLQHRAHCLSDPSPLPRMPLKWPLPPASMSQVLRECTFCKYLLAKMLSSLRSDVKESHEVDCEVHFDVSLTGSDSLMAAMGSGGLHILIMSMCFFTALSEKRLISPLTLMSPAVARTMPPSARLRSPSCSQAHQSCVPLA